MITLKQSMDLAGRSGGPQFRRGKPQCRAHSLKSWASPQTPVSFRSIRPVLGRRDPARPTGKSTPDHGQASRYVAGSVYQNSSGFSLSVDQRIHRASAKTPFWGGPPVPLQMARWLVQQVKDADQDKDQVGIRASSLGRPIFLVLRGTPDGQLGKTARRSTGDSPG